MRTTCLICGEPGKAITDARCPACLDLTREQERIKLLARSEVMLERFRSLANEAYKLGDTVAHWEMAAQAKEVEKRIAQLQAAV